MSLTGINRGYLFGIGAEPHKDHVYVVDPMNPADPFANPNLQRVFDGSEVIVSEFQKPLFDPFETLPKLLEETLRPEELRQLRDTLAPIADQKPGLKVHIERCESDAKAIMVLVVLGMLNLQKSYKEQGATPSPSGTIVGALYDRATLMSKEIVPLGEGDTEEKAIEVFSLLLQEPELLRAILFALTSRELMSSCMGASALERGNYEENTGIPDLDKEDFLTNTLSGGGINLEKLENSVALMRLIDMALTMSDLSEKINSFVHTDKRHLFLISPSTLADLSMLPLTQIKIPVKPVGFYWTVRDEAGHEGLLVGSMHLTAEKLVNFPQKILEIFDSSEAMAVEIDVTREDVLARKDEVSWETAQTRQLELLSPTEKETLFNCLKPVYPDIESDEPTQFLLQALRKMAGKEIAKHLSAKDEKTKQSFIGTGIEDVFIKRAKEKGLPIKDLETFEDHFIKFSTGPASVIPVVRVEQMQAMIGTFSSEDAMLELFCQSDNPLSKIKTQRDLFKLFQKHPLQKYTDTMESGDSDVFEREYAIEPNPVATANIIARNQNMAAKIGEFMNSGQKHFCIAGALHMVGPSSIPILLRQMGYTVERLIVEEPL